MPRGLPTAAFSFPYRAQPRSDSTLLALPWILISDLQSMPFNSFRYSSSTLIGRMAEGDGFWTPTEEQKLLDLVRQHGQDWHFISRRMPGRTLNAVSSKYYRLLSRSQSPQSYSDGYSASSSSPPGAKVLLDFYPISELPYYEDPLASFSWNVSGDTLIQDLWSSIGDDLDWPSDRIALSIGPRGPSVEPPYVGSILFDGKLSVAQVLASLYYSTDPIRVFYEALDWRLSDMKDKKTVRVVFSDRNSVSISFSVFFPSNPDVYDLIKAAIVHSAVAPTLSTPLIGLRVFDFDHKRCFFDVKNQTDTVYAHSVYGLSEVAPEECLLGRSKIVVHLIRVSGKPTCMPFIIAASPNETVCDIKSRILKRVQTLSADAAQQAAQIASIDCWTLNPNLHVSSPCADDATVKKLNLEELYVYIRQPSSPAVSGCPHNKQVFATGRFAKLPASFASSPSHAPSSASSTLPLRELSTPPIGNWSKWHVIIPETPNGDGWFSAPHSRPPHLLTDVLPAQVLAFNVYGTYELAVGIHASTVYTGCSQNEEDDLRSIFRRFYLEGAHLRDLLFPYLHLGSMVQVRWTTSHGEASDAVTAAKQELSARLLSYDYAFKDAPLASRYPLFSEKITLMDHLIKARHGTLTTVEQHICELLEGLTLEKQNSLLTLLHQYGVKKQPLLMAAQSTPPEASFVFPPPPPVKRP